MAPVVVEAAVESLEEALAAAEIGADRIELCADLAVGGTTPSAGTIALACERLRVPVFVMVRTRGGDFTASPLEHEVMLRDVIAARTAGAHGVVLGILTPDARVDIERTRALVDAARPLPVTFHMAFDRARDRAEALDDLLAAGATRILTSGGAGRAARAVPVLRDLVRRAEGRLTIVAGGGVVAEDVGALVREAGVREVHARMTSAERMSGVVRAARESRKQEAGNRS